ncbi:MAG: hypothetical protein ABSF32_00200 [Ignavibacteria bacterium]
MSVQDLPYKKFDDLKCIWMSSNLVEYKLCDKDFDCENCEFDQVMRNQASIKQGEGQYDSPNADFFKKIIQKLKNDVKYRRPPYYYLKNNLIVKNLFGNIFYIGINPAVLILIDCQNSVRFLTNGDRYVQRGVSFLKIQGEWGSVDIASPITFLFLNKSEFDSFDFLTNEWFGLIEADREDILNASYSETEYEINLSNMEDTLHNYLTTYPETGVTIMDGGKNVRYLYEAIGKKNYSCLINSFFKK